MAEKSFNGVINIPDTGIPVQVKNDVLPVEVKNQVQQPLNTVKPVCLPKDGTEVEVISNAKVSWLLLTNTNSDPVVVILDIDGQRFPVVLGFETKTLPLKGQVGSIKASFGPQREKDVVVVAIYEGGEE